MTYESTFWIHVYKNNLRFQRLTEPKLQSLFSDLKIHDKEELVHKHSKADGGDPEGLEEARLRKKLMGTTTFLSFEYYTPFYYHRW